MFAKPTPEDIIRAIRNDGDVGRGSGSIFDDCYDDEALVEYFGEHCETIDEVLSLARIVQRASREIER